MAPVLNLSGTSALDPLKITDTIASEFLSTSTAAVVPINMTLAALSRRGQTWVETPEDAIDLARELGADATVVTAVTEYDPYDPPIIGLVMQWYAVPRDTWPGGLDPVTTSRRAAEVAPARLSASQEFAPRFQVQRVFDASRADVLKEVREFAGQRSGHQSPHGWRRYIKSQELYVRYSVWSTIRTMQRLCESRPAAAVMSEADS